MAGGPGAAGAASDAAADFRDFATATESHCLRVATLVTGSEAAGRAVALDSLVRVARDWSEAREEGPDGVLREAMYRRAVAAASREPATPVRLPRVEPVAAVPDGGERWGADPDLLEAGRVALADLDPQGRAVALLHFLEERSEAEIARVTGSRADTVSSRVRSSRERLAAAFAEVGRDLDPSDDEVRDLLESLTDAVPEQALADEAWTEAGRRRSLLRRRTVVGAAVLVGGLGGAAALADSPAPRVAPGPTVSRAARGGGRLAATVVDGVRVVLAPDPRSEQILPSYPDAPALALPGGLGPGLARPLRALSGEGTDASVRAVYLVRIGTDRFGLAVFVPGATTQSLIIDMQPLVETRGEPGRRTPSLGPRTIHDDRHQIVVAQPRAVVVVDVRTAAVRALSVPDDGLVEAGWAKDGRTVIARGGGRSWLVDTDSGLATETEDPVSPGWADLHREDGVTTLRTFSGGGTETGSRTLTGPDVNPYGESVANTEGWASSGAYLAPAFEEALGRSQGLVAVQGDLRPTPRVLAAFGGPSVPLAAYRPLTWGPRDTVILESFSFGDPADPPVRRVLAWDVVGERLYRVAELAPISSGPDQAFTGAWAL